MSTSVKKMSILEAVQKIVHHKLLLPAIQRDYVWKRQAIEMMFDSIMRGYPINTLMFWRIDNIGAQPLDFYSFLPRNYVYGITRNQEFDKTAAGQEEKLIVIDGQQRLTSIYIGLYGTYTTGKAKFMSLYLRLDKEASDDEKMYDFRFLTDTQVNRLRSEGGTWFKMYDLTQGDNDLLSALNVLSGNNFAKETVKTLLTLLSSDDYLHYYDVFGYKSIDDVLEIFTRTNNSGTPLSKGDLLLSIMTTRWSTQGNAREYVKEVIDNVKTIGFVIDRDWVIKCCLVLFGSSVKMTVANFSSSQDDKIPITQKIFNEKDNIKEAISATFELISSFGLIEKGLSTKLAVIPIVQFIYKWKLWNTVNKAIKGQSFNTTGTRDYRHDIRKWLFRAIVSNLFEARTDDILTKVKKIIEDNSSRNYFPYKEIEQQFSTLQQLDMDSLLDTQKVSAFPILNIIFCEKGLKKDKPYDMDHTHPAVLFNNLANIQFSTPADRDMAADGKTYNSVRNLQLLESGDNKSKNKMTLMKWIDEAGDPQALGNKHCIPLNVSLDIADFKSYIEERSKLLRSQLQKYLEINNI